MSNYPPGVTGNEYAIAGADSETETDRYCSRCHQVTTHTLLTFGHEAWTICSVCEQQVDVDPEDEVDWDAEAERRRDLELDREDDF